MKIYYFFTLTIIILITACSRQEQSSIANQPTMHPAHTLWYENPAKIWYEALPLGNGRFGAMAFGGTKTAHYQINEDSMWPGHADDSLNNGTPADIVNFRKLLAQGKQMEVEKNIMHSFGPKDNFMRSHQTMGDVYIKNTQGNDTATDYQRSLDLQQALFVQTHTQNNVRFSQEMFASNPHQVQVIALRADKTGQISFDLSLDRPKDKGLQTVNITVEGNRIFMRGRLTQQAGMVKNVEKKSNEFILIADLQHSGGTLSQKDGKLVLIGANAADIYLAGTSAFYTSDFEQQSIKQLDTAIDAGYKAVRQAHITDHASLYKRAMISLPLTQDSALPSDERINLARKDVHNDPALNALLFHYGRYMLIASSRPSTMPAALQGIWNNKIDGAWNAAYFLNVNLQMNYWPAEVTNLSELNGPLFDFTEKLAKRGEIRARDTFDARGWVVGHYAQGWAEAWTKSKKPFYGMWHHSGTWLMQHFWYHYKYTQDKTWLKQTAWPLMKGQSEFQLDWLVEDNNGQLVSGPSTSPENSFLFNGERASIVMGPAFDQQLIAELFSNTLAAAEILGINDQFTTDVKEAYAKLKSGLNIGSDGRLMEWAEEYEEFEPGHRHMSHLYSLFPGNAVSPVLNPELTAAITKSLDHRLANNSPHTGWSRAWAVNLKARLLKGDEALHQIHEYQRINVLPNYFNRNDPTGPLLTDGSLGVTSGIAEMLLQSQSGFVHILPALPAVWVEGSYSGFKAQNGFEIDVDWKNSGCSIKVSVKSLNGNDFKLYDPKSDFTIKSNGEIIKAVEEPHGIKTIVTKPGGIYTLHKNINTGVDCNFESNIDE